MKYIVVIVTLLLLLLPKLVFAHSAPMVIKMSANGFEPQEITIDSDSTILFQNIDTQDHWPASDIHPTHDIYPQFDPQKPIKSGESWQFKPTRFGTFKYHDHLNPHMRGVLKVSGQQSELSSVKTEPVDLNLEVKRITQAGFLRLKNEDEDEGSYLRSQMDYCFNWGGRDYCYKDLATILTFQFSLPQILDLLQKNEQYSGVFARCHELTHYLTRLAYTKEKSISAVYEKCSSVCHGGCYHGAIEQYLSDKKLSLDNISKINQEIPKVCGKQEDYKVPLLYDECIHGIGHGTMYINDGDLIVALNLCDNLQSQKGREGCYSGAFMENSSSSTNLDHPSKFIKADDPMYPCNILDQKYLPLCFRYQSSHFAIISQSNWVEVARLCKMVPQEYQKMCFLTVGSNQVGFTQDFKLIKDDCMLMPDTLEQDFCFQGVVDALAIRYRGDARRGFQFCSQLESNFQASCFKQYGHSISSWSNNPLERIKLCEEIGNPQFAKWCKSGDKRDSFLDVLKDYFNNFMGRISKVFEKVRHAKGQDKLDIKIEDLKEMAATDGVEKTWQFLADTFKNESGSSGNIHDLSHFVGGLVYDEKGLEGLRICTPNFAFGCFHGFLDKAFEKNLNGLNQAQIACEKLGKGGPVASCIHGIGHGVASFYQTHDLANSLSVCDKLSSLAQYCHDGVFMEFARNAPTSFYKLDDKLYPCSKVELQYAFSCGRNQVRVMMDRFGSSFEEVSNACSSSQNVGFKKGCFSALGFHAASYANGNSDDIIVLCTKIDNLQGQNECLKAAAGEVIFQNMPNWPTLALKICQGLGSDFEKECREYTNQIKKDYAQATQ